jgi:GNAT superfamily N-acetyltransferase
LTWSNGPRYLTAQDRALPAGALAPTAADRQAHDFAVPFCTGYGIPAEAHEATERNLPVEYADPGWRIYVAYMDGQPAAVACLHLEGDAGCVAAMATAPPFRRRGCQSALLRRCVADSAAAGCQLLAYQAGPGSDSERNVLRHGFQIAYTKVVLSPSDTLGGQTSSEGAVGG